VTLSAARCRKEGGKGKPLIHNPLPALRSKQWNGILRFGSPFSSFRSGSDSLPHAGYGCNQEVCEGFVIAEVYWDHVDEFEIAFDAGDVALSSGGAISVRAIAGSGIGSHIFRSVVRCGNAVLDMRGKCSAGQKVIACLVISLALADSFFTDYGELALDEPTTNLDRGYEKRLARALTGIIEHRQKQAHFQLPVILMAMISWPLTVYANVTIISISFTRSAVEIPSVPYPLLLKLYGKRYARF
jgi:hypothetical protein